MPLTPPIVELQAAWHAMSRLSLLPALQERLAAESGIAIPRTGRVVLAHLSQCDDARISELAAAASVDISTMSRALRPLDDAGYIKRQPGHDLRAVRVSITPAGRDAVARHMLAAQRMLADVLEGWSEADRTLLADLMRRFAEDFAGYVRAEYAREPAEARS